MSDEHVVKIGLAVDLAPVKRGGDEYAGIISRMQAATENALKIMSAAMGRHTNALTDTNATSSLVATTIQKSASSYKALAATIADAEQAARAATAADEERVRLAEEEIDTLNRLERETRARLAEINATEGGLRQLTEVERVHAALIRQGVTEQSALARAMVESAQMIDQLNAHYRQAADATKEAEAVAEKHRRETEEQADALRRLEREHQAQAKAVALSAAGTKKLTREQQVYVEMTRRGISESDAYGKRMIQLAKNMDRLEGEFADSSQASKTLNADMQQLGRGFGVVIGAFAAGTLVSSSIDKLDEAARKTLETLSGYKQRLAELSAITGVTGSGLDQLSVAAQDMGANTKFAAAEAATAFKLVASAKAELANNLGSLESVTREVLTLAAASGETLPNSAQIATATMNQFQLAAQDASRVINVLAAGSQKGASEIAETGEALRYAGTLANTANVQLEATVAAIQVLATNEIKASAAGTGLASVLASLEKQTDKRFKPSIVGLGNALANLQDENLDLTRLIKLFGLEAAKSGDVLIKNAAKFRGLEAAITGTNTATEQARVQSDTLEGSWLSLQSALQALQVSVGEVFEEDIRKAAEELREMAVAVKFWSANLEKGYESTKKLVERLTALSALTPALSSTFNTLVSGGLEFGKAVDIANTLARVEASAARMRRELEGQAKRLAEAAKESDTYATAVRSISEAEAAFSKKMEQSAFALELEIQHFGEAQEVIEAYATLKREGVPLNDGFAKSLIAQAKATAKLRERLEGLKKEEKAAAKATQEAEKNRKAAIDTINAITVETEINASIIQRTIGGYHSLTQVEETHYKLMKEGIPVWSAIGVARLEAAKRLDDLTKAAQRNREQKELDDSINEETEALIQLNREYDRTERELLELYAAQMRAAGASESVVQAWLAASEAAIDMRQASEEAARATELFADVAQASMDVITQAGLDLWSGQLESFGDFRDAVLDGLAEIAAQMVAMSAIQWALPENLGGIGGAFGGFGQTDLGQLLTGGKGVTSALANSNIGGSLMSNHGGFSGFNAGAAGPFLATTAVLGTLATAIDSISGGKLFGTSWETLSHTVEVSINDGFVAAVERLVREREGSLFSGTKEQVTENPFGERALAPIQAIYEQIDAYVTETAEALGLDVSQRFIDVLGESFSVGVVAGENLAGAVSRYLERFGERWVSQVAPGIELTVNAGEDLYAAFGRIAQGAGLLAENLAPLGTTLDQLIGADWIADVIEQMAVYQANQAQAGVLSNAALDGFDPLGAGFVLPADGVITDQMRADIEATAQRIADAMGGITADIEQVLWDGATAFEAAKLVYINELENLAGGQEALAERFRTHAETWQVSSEAAQSTLEVAMGQIQAALAAQFEALGTSRDQYLADYEAAVSGALTPEQLDTWTALGVEIGRLMEYERELARIRGEAVDIGSLTQNQRAALDAQLESFNALMEEMGLAAVESGQALLNLESQFGSVNEIASQLERVYAAMVPEIERNARSMEQLETASTALGINLTASADEIRAQYMSLYNAALAIGDTDAIAQLDAVFGSLLDHTNSLEQAEQAQQAQAEASQQAAQRAADDLAAFNERISGLGPDLLYTAEQAEVLVGVLGSLDQVAQQWQIVWDDMFSAAERAEITLAQTGEMITAAGVDLGQLSEKGAGYYRDMLLHAQRLNDTARVAQLLDVADEVRDWVDASAELAEAAETAAAETAAWAESVSSVQSRIATMIQGINDNGLIPTSQIDAINASIERMRALISDASSVQEELRLQEELAGLIAQRYEIERQGIIDSAQTSLDAENARIRSINEAARAAYQSQLAYVRELQRIGQSATQWINRNATTNLAPVTQIDIVSDQFAAAIDAVLNGGNTDANITGLADQYTALAEQIYGASPEFYRLVGEIEGALGDVAALADSTDTPVEPPEIPLMRELRDFAELGSTVDQQIIQAQRGSTDALRAISDRTAELMEEAEQAEAAHRAQQVAHWDAIQAATRGTETATDETARTSQQFWPAAVGHLERIVGVTTNSGEYAGRMFQLMSGGVPLEATVRSQMAQQTGLLGQIVYAVQSLQASNSAGLWGVNAAVNNLELPPVNIEFVLPEGYGGGTGSTGDEDLDAQERAKRWGR